MLVMSDAVTTSGIDRSLLTKAYLYGFPLVFNLEQVRRYVRTGIGAVPAAPWNTFGHARTLAGPADTFVTINNDTLYSMAQIDVSVGPVRLRVPDTAGRYYVLQFVSAWTDNFAYVGHRATGTAAGEFLLVPPGWSGDAADASTAEADLAATTVIHFPTTVASIVGRWAVADGDDLSTVHALQDATTLTPVAPAAVPVGLAEPDAGVPDAVAFLEELRVWSQQFPPAARDLELQRSFGPAGITAPSSSYLDLPEATTESLADGIAAGHAALEHALSSGASPQVNGWKLTLHAFDYNLDFFEVGALDDERFEIADPELRIVERAAAALGGLWGNHAYEAAYIMTYVDDHDEQLTGSRTYALRLDPTPPVGAFWSLTMYSVPDYFLVANPIDRYSVGDRTPGLVRDEDGALTITISHEPPADPNANWLPSPAGDFRPILRMYEPDDAVLDGEWTAPPIVRRT
ncbi:hypothetical protein EDF55_0465 [Curtobacterium sp. ZW137]|nr:hypothetical protein EDF55_0465 [Curtobacterium sp. ZW137]